MRLDKYITTCLDVSRKEIKRQIKDGRVTVNGEICTDSGANVAETDAVTLDGERLLYNKYIYLMLNKPAGYVSAVRDRNYPPVTDLVPPEYAHYGVYPAGRLDRMTEGLLLLTNDGDFAHRLTSPNKNVYKRYFTRLDAPMEERDKEAFAAGMELKDFTAKPARLEITDDPTEVYIEIAEGKFHQVRRMCARLGKNVLYLKRVKIGALTLDPSLELGHVKMLTEQDIKKAFSN